MLNDNSDKTDRLVCFFDSGIGGLNLMYNCYKRCVDCNFAYFADNYNMPYGSKPPEEVLKTVDGYFERIALLKPAVAVVACNTVTAECICFLREKYPFPIVGIQPAVKPAVKSSKKCIVLATPATIKSQAVRELVRQYGEGKTELVPCENLAAYIENNIFDMVEEEVISMLPPAECDGVVLGCTHYTYVSDIISRFYNCSVYDGTEGTTNQICKILGKSDHHGFLSKETAFYGGNCIKNAKIFDFLKQNINFCKF